MTELASSVFPTKIQRVGSRCDDIESFENRFLWGGRLKLTAFHKDSATLPEIKSEGDVYVFPDQKLYQVDHFTCSCVSKSSFYISSYAKGVALADLRFLIDSQQKVKYTSVEDIAGHPIFFVCAHGSRDKRCGVAGPVITEELERIVPVGEGHVHMCSHVGGHKFAG